MGLFDWLWPRAPLGITCWLDEPSRLHGFVRDVAADRARGERVLVVGHFPQALVATGERLAAAGIPFVTKARRSDDDTRQLPAQTPGSVRLCDLHVLVAENDRVERFARSLPGGARVAASVSFDDPIMAEFASPWLRSMLERLGLRPDAPIDHPMVSKGLRRALQKLGRRASGNTPCDSLPEWMQRNLRP